MVCCQIVRLCLVTEGSVEPRTCNASKMMMMVMMMMMTTMPMSMMLMVMMAMVLVVDEEKAGR